MNDWIVKDVDTGDTWHRDSRSDAEDAVDEFGAMRDLEIVPPNKATQDNPPHDHHGNPVSATDGGTETVQPGVVDNTRSDQTNTVEPEKTVEKPKEYDLPDEPQVDTNPIEWMPSHFIDEIQGVPTVNRMGYCILCEQYGVSVKAEPVTLPSETDFEYAEFRAVATTEDGQEYTGFGSAHVDRQDGDDPYLLAELAETRSLKRAAAWATGIGMTAAVEMGGSE